MKKQLVINNLTFEVHCEIYDGYGDAEQVNRRFTVDRKTCTLMYRDLNDGSEQTVILTQEKMHKLLKWIVHSLEVFMWEKDYCSNFHSDNLDLECLDDELRDESLYFTKFLSLPVEHTDEIPAWSIHVEYSNPTVQDTVCYGEGVTDKVEELYLELLEHFSEKGDFADGELMMT